MSQDLNYYCILGIPKNACKVQICQAYKELALKYHPSLKHDNENQTYKKFCLVAEAFDVLYNDEKKNIYDQYGEQRLKEGIIDEKGQRGTGNYILSNQPQVIFEKFFGTKNVYEHLLSVGQGEGKSHPIFSSQYGPNANIQPRKVPDLVVPIQCCLSQLYNGCKKVKSYPKNVLSLDGQSVQTVNQTKEIQIPKGRCSKNPIVFKGQGNQEPGQQPSDLVFQIVEINEMCFRRCQKNPADIIYTAKISLMDALDSKSITIKQLHGQVSQLHFDEIINPQTERVIQGRGMANEDESGRGNLIVRFDIEFPEQIEINKKARIVELLTVS